MIYLESDSHDPYLNLALEEYAFEVLGAEDDVFMLWQNDNTVVVGKYQVTAEEVDAAYVREHGVRVARRLSGGGAVYHDAGNLNFTFVADGGDLSQVDFARFVEPVISCLARLGVKAELTGRNDLVIDGEKFSGNSQYTKHGRTMSHGCIMVDSNVDVATKVLRPKAAKFTTKAAKSVRSRVTTINEHAPRPISVEEFKRALLEEVERTQDMTRHVLSSEERSRVEELARTKYATWGWNWGSSPDYEVVREEKFPAGLVSVRMDVADGRIEAIRIFGDFFGSGDLSELEEELVGMPLDDALEERLEPLGIGRYMAGITPGELASLLRME